MAEMTDQHLSRDVDVKRVAAELHLRYDQVQHTVQLLDWMAGGPRPPGVSN